MRLQSLHIRVNTTSDSRAQSAANPPITGQTKGLVDEKNPSIPPALVLEGMMVADLVPVLLEVAA